MLLSVRLAWMTELSPRMTTSWVRVDQGGYPSTLRGNQPDSPAAQLESRESRSFRAGTRAAEFIDFFAGNFG